jgi:hypothetical protein
MNNKIKLYFQVYKQIENPTYKDTLFRIIQSQPNIKQVELYVCFSDGHVGCGGLLTIQECKAFVNLICSKL